MRVVVFLTCGKHLHYRIISPRVEVLVHKTSLTPPLIIEVPVPSQEVNQFYLCFCDFGNVPTLWYFLWFHFIIEFTFNNLLKILINFMLHFFSSIKCVLHLMDNRTASVFTRVFLHNYKGRTQTKRHLSSNNVLIYSSLSHFCNSNVLNHYKSIKKSSKNLHKIVVTDVSCVFPTTKCCK